MSSPFSSPHGAQENHSSRLKAGSSKATYLPRKARRLRFAFIKDKKSFNAIGERTKQKFTLEIRVPRMLECRIHKMHRNNEDRGTLYECFLGVLFERDFSIL